MKFTLKLRRVNDFSFFACGFPNSIKAETEGQDDYMIHKQRVAALHVDAPVQLVLTASLLAHCRLSGACDIELNYISRRNRFAKMTELQPLYDTAGAGLSLLDTILHTRVSLEGVVSRTVTRLLYACKYSSGASPQELCEHQAQLLSDADPEATGLLLVQPTSFWGFVETSPETVAALLRWIDSELTRADGEGRLRSCRVIVQIEDCPSRAFGPWSYRSLMLPPESGIIDLDAQSPVAFSSQFYHTAMSIGAAVLEAGPSVLDQLQERFGSGLPSDERVCALSEWSKLTSCREWLDIFDSPPSFTPMDEEVFPLPSHSIL